MKTARNQKPTLTMQQRQANEAVLKRMQTIDNYQKNPRFRATLPDLRATPPAAPQETAGPFRIEPPEVIFTDYEAGRIYEQTVKIVNVARFICRLQVIPPQTEEYSIDAPVYPDPLSGNVAPGMSVFVKVHFKPSAMTSFNDRLLIGTEEDVIELLLNAKRKDLILKFNPELVFPAVWVGFSSEGQLVLENKGGEGEFTLEGEGQFMNIGPKHFSLKAGESITLKGKFSPTKEGDFTTKIIIRADTGAEWPLILRGKGNMLDLHVTNLAGLMLEQKDPLQTIFIKESYPNSHSEVTLTIKNLAFVPFKYQWEVQSTHGRFEVEPK